MKTRTLMRIFLLLIVAFSLMAVGQTAEEAGKTQQTQTAPQTSPQTQGTERTLASRLGYSSDTKLLILHADDLGMAHSVNDASMKAMDAGAISSGSIMVPCPWFPEISSYARAHPDADLGLHLTLTSEWQTFRWGPVLPKNLVPSLFDPQGYLYPTEDVAAAHIDPREAEAEIRAQIERARANGIAPTHLDSHMRTLYQNQALCEAFLRVGRETRIPVMIANEWFTDMKYLPSILKPEDPVVNDVISIGTDVKPSKWFEAYKTMIEGIKPGITVLIVHLAHDDNEMRAIAFGHEDWGSSWRQRDFDFVTGDQCKQLLKQNKVQLVTWREIQKAVYPTP